MNKNVLMAAVMSMTCLIAVMLWAQAGRFETHDSVYKAQAALSIKAPYQPMPLNPINY
jgi:hypothetical protein